MVTVWKRDVALEVAKKYKSQVLDGMKGFIVSLELDDKALDELEKDKGGQFIAQRMVEDAQDECEKTVDIVVAEAKKLDKECEGKDEDSIDKRRLSFGAWMGKQVSDLSKSVEAVPEKRFEKWAATQAAWKKYKLKIAGKFVLGSLGAIKVGFAIAAAVPTGGASLAYAIVKGVQQGANLLQEISKIAMEAETVQKRIHKKLEEAENTVLQTKNKAINTGIDILSQAFNNLVSVDLMPTSAVLKADCELWKQKLAHLEVKAVAGSKLAMETLDQATELEKKFKEAKASNFKEAGKIFASLSTVRTKLTEFMDTCGTLGKRVADGEKAYTNVTTKLLPAILAKKCTYKFLVNEALPLAAAATGDFAIAAACKGESLAAALDASKVLQKLIDAI